MSILVILEGGAFFSGVAVGAASMMSVGPNNLTLVREGLVRGRIGLVASVMWTSYLVLLTSALLLGDKIAKDGMVLRPFLSAFGLLALCWFAFQSLQAYFRSRIKISLIFLERELTRD